MFWRLRNSDLYQHRLLGTIKRSRDPAIVRRYLAAHPHRKLQIGAGLNLRDGWLNTNWYPVDLASQAIFLDATEPFPLPSDTFGHVFSEHMIEHVPYLGGMAMLRECHRVLRPGGRLRLSTPDIAFLADLLKPDLSDIQRDYVRWAGATFLQRVPVTPLTVVNNYVRDWGHVFIWDRATMEAALHEVGFVDVTPHGVGESGDPDMRGIDHPQRMPEGFLALESMIYEAVKAR
jgi:predicted SAM-dependent methyltransferase